MAEVLEQLVIDVVAKSDKAKADLEAFLKSATTYAERLKKDLNAALTLPSVNAGTITTLADGLQRAGIAATPVADRIGRIAERIRTLNAQYTAGFTSEEQYRRGLEQLTQGLERTGRQADLTQKDLGDLARAAIEVNTGLASIGRGSGRNTDDATQAARKLRDAITGLKNESLALRNAYEADLITQDELVNGMKRLREESERLASGLDKTSREYKDLTTVMGRAARTQATVAGQTTKLGFSANALVGINNSLVGSFRQLVGLGVGVSLAAAARNAFNLALENEKLTVSFNTLIGSAERAEALLGDLREFGRTTPFQFPELAEAARSLVAFGISAEDVVPTLRRIGDVSAGVGQSVGEVAEIYGKARVQGRLFAEDINQLTGRGIPIIGELARQFGVTEQEVRALVESGQVGFEQLERAFVTLTSAGGKFYGLTQAQADTTAGKLSNLSDSADELGRSLAEAILPTATRVVEGLTGITTALNGMNPGLRDATVQAGLMGTALVPVGAGLVFLAAKAPEVVVGLNRIKTAMLPLVGPAGLFALGATAVGLYANSLLTAANAANQFAGTVGVQGLGEEAQSVANSIRTLEEGKRDFILQQGEAVSQGLQSLEESRAAVQRYEERIEALRDRFAELVRAQNTSAAVPPPGDVGAPAADILEQVRATQAFINAQEDLGRISRSDAVTGLQELRATLQGLNVDFEKNPQLAAQVAQALVGLEGDIRGTTTATRSARDVLEDLGTVLSALEQQGDLFSGFDVDTAKLEAVRNALTELTRLPGDNSAAIRDLRQLYTELGGEAADLAAQLDLARQAQQGLARAFTTAIVLDVQFGRLDEGTARAELEAAINRLNEQIGEFDAVELKTSEARTEVDALRERLGLATAALEAINQASLAGARANLAKLVSDADTGRQSLEAVGEQLGILTDGLARKIAELERGGITTLELQPYLDATSLLAQVQDALAGIQSAVLDRDLLEVRMGLRPQDDLERDLRARLDAAQAQLDTFNPTIPLDLDLSSLEGVRAAVDAASADTFLALEAEVEGLTAALDALREARSQTQQAFNERLVLGVDVGAVDASTAQGILEAQLESLRADLQRKIESVDLTVEGAIDPQLAADIDTLAAEVEALEGLLDRVFGRPIPVPQGTAEITDDYRAVRAAAEDAERGLATLQARAVVGGESLDYSSEAASILRAALVKLKADGIDPTTAGYADLEAQLESFTRAQEQQEEALRNAQRAVSNFLAPLSVAARGALEPLGELASAYGDVAKLTGQTETPLERLTATLERLAAGNNLAAFGARRLLAELDRFNVGNDPILDRVRATQRFTEAQFELGRITRSQALASLTELQAELSGLTASFEDSPERAQALADAMLALTASIDGLTVNAGGLAALSEQFAGLQGEVSALGVESGTVFDQMRRKLAEFTAGFEGADLLSLGFDLRPLREDINTLELDDLTRGVEALGLQGASAFDTMRDRLEAFAARVPNSRAEVDALLEELRGFEQLDASDKLADLITQIEQLERDDTQFDTLRTNLREIGTEAGLTEEQIEALLERIAALERASALEAFNQSTNSFLQAAGVAVGTFDDLRDAAQAAFDTGAIGAERFERRLAAIGVLELGEDIRQLAAEFDGAFSLAAEALASTADGIAVIIDAGGELEGTLRGVAVAASGIAQALPEQNGLASQFLEAGAALGGMIAEIAGATPGVGQLVAAVGDLFTRLLGDISGGIAEIEQQVRDTASRFPLLGEALVQGIADANTKTVNAGGLYGLLGGTTQDLDEAAFDAGVSLANNLAQGLADAFSADTLEEFRERFTESLNNTILEAAINAAVLDASLQEQIAELAAAITAAFANDGRLDPEEIAAINAKRDALIQAGEEVYNELSKLPFFGSDGETLTVDVQAPDLGSTFNLPDRIIATPNVTPMVDLTTSQQDLAKVMRESVGVQRALVDAFQAGLPLRVENADGTTSRAVLDAVSIFGRA